MPDFKKQLLGVLNEIKGSGSFVSTGSSGFLFPGLEIQGVGEIGFPVNPLEIKAMIKTARKAPFGKGSKTVLDTNVRSAWEIDAGQITFRNSDWNKFTENLIEHSVKPGLGIGEHTVSASFYKLLIYEEGDFFLAHKDSEKEKGMFGTLIIGLPSRHSGGELTVKFDGRTETIDFSEAANQYQIPFAAFYADCEHEITPITSGYRVCLVYNLVQKKGREKIQIHQLGGYADRLAAILKTCEEDRDIPKIVLLGHQYTPSNFTMETLKLNDRPKAEALLLAAQKAGFYAKLGLVTSWQSGELEIDYRKGSSSSRNRKRYDDDYDDDSDLEENGTMGEIYDEGIEIEHWMPEGIPALRNISFAEEDLISAVRLNEGEPAEKQAEGYTGNAGMEMQYWYHYGAVFLWPKKYQYDMLAGLSPENKLEWIAYYNTHWHAVEPAEKALVKRLAEEGLDENNPGKHLDYSPLADWLINLNDEKYLSEEGAVFLINYFGRISIEHWKKLLATYPVGCFEKICSAAGKKGQSSTVQHLLSLLNELSDTGKYKAFVMKQTDQIPQYLHALRLSDKAEHAMSKNILQNVLKLSKLKAGDDVWHKVTTETFTKVATRKYVNDVLVGVVLEWNKESALATRIIAVCKQDLAVRVNNKPQPPADWSRPLPQSSGRYKKVWALLADFLQSPVQQVFDYRKPQAERSEMESAIQNVTIDLRTETIRKGSPHTLRLIKTRDTYERDLAEWEADVMLLKKVNDFQRHVNE